MVLFQKMREKRDVAIHYSKSKREIMFSPQEWLDEAFDISELVNDASRKIKKDVMTLITIRIIIEKVICCISLDIFLCRIVRSPNTLILLHQLIIY